MLCYYLDYCSNEREPGEWADRQFFIENALKRKREYANGESYANQIQLWVAEKLIDSSDLAKCHPKCSKCGGDVRIQQNRKNKRNFFGCKRCPQCKGTTTWHEGQLYMFNKLSPKANEAKAMLEMLEQGDRDMETMFTETVTVLEQDESGHQHYRKKRKLELKVPERSALQDREANIRWEKFSMMDVRLLDYIMTFVPLLEQQKIFHIFDPWRYFWLSDKKMCSLKYSPDHLTTYTSRTSTCSSSSSIDLTGSSAVTAAPRVLKGQALRVRSEITKQIGTSKLPFVSRYGHQKNPGTFFQPKRFPLREEGDKYSTCFVMCPLTEACQLSTCITRSCGRQVCNVHGNMHVPALLPEQQMSFPLHMAHVRAHSGPQSFEPHLNAVAISTCCEAKCNQTYCGLHQTRYNFVSCMACAYEAKTFPHLLEDAADTGMEPKRFAYCRKHIVNCEAPESWESDNTDVDYDNEEVCVLLICPKHQVKHEHRYSEVSRVEDYYGEKHVVIENGYTYQDMAEDNYFIMKDILSFG